jgi:fido (protein-threonine AMPylation protein)
MRSCDTCGKASLSEQDYQAHVKSKKHLRMAGEPTEAPRHPAAEAPKRSLSGVLVALCTVLAVLAQWKSKDLYHWYTFRGPCQNDISFSSSLWSVMSGDKPGPNYGGYNNMALDEWISVCESGRIWAEWAHVFDDNTIRITDDAKKSIALIDEKQHAVQKHLASPSECKEDAYKAWFSDFKIRFTHISTFIEGGQYTRDEVQRLVSFGVPASSKSELEAWEVSDHAIAWEYVKMNMAPKPLSDYTLRDILKIHDYLTHRLLPGASGKLRNREVWLSNSPLVTPRKEEVHQLMINLVKWLNNRNTRDTHPVVIAAAFHIRFASIHPFRDGNGRMARLLTNAILLSTGYIPITAGGEENDMVQQKQQYYDSLVDFTLRHDMSAFIRFILKGEQSSVTKLVEAMNVCDAQQ